MAEVKGVSITATTVQSLKADIKALKDEISALILVDGNYQKQAEQLTQKQLQLSKATEVTKGAVAGVENSYAQLVAQTNALRKEWRSVDMGSERFKELSEQINTNNKRLKEMDKSIGDNFRNVGNYTEGFSKALGTLGGQFPSVQSGIMGVQKGFNLLNTNPILATFTAIVLVIQKVINVMKQSESGTQALATVMGAFDGVLTLVTKGFEFLGKGIAWVVEKVTDLTAKWFGQNTAIKENVAIQNEQIALDKLKRENLVKEAQLEYEISELRAKSADKIKYSAKERIAFLEQAMNKELELSKMAQEEAQKEYELIVLKNKQTKSGTKDLDAEAQALANVTRAQTEYNKKIREYNAQLTEAKTQAGIKRKTDAVPLSVEVEAKVKILPTDIDLTDVTDETEKELAEIPLKANEALRKGLEQDTAERLRYAELYGESTYNIQQQALYNEMALLQEGLDSAVFYGDERIKAEERVAQIQKDIAYNTKKYQKEQQKEVAQGAVAVATASMQAMGSIFGSIADMYEQNNEQDKKSMQKAKNLRIAGATMDMLGGITAALAGAFTTKTGPWDWIIAGIQASTILASGIANIAKIRNTDTSGNSASSTSSGGGIGAVVNPPAIVQQVPVTRTLTGVAEEERLNQAQKVYVVYDDIAQVGRKVEVTENEATF